MSNLHTHYHFTLDLKKVAQQTGGKLLVNSTKHRKENRLHSLEQGNIDLRVSPVYFNVMIYVVKFVDNYI